MDESKSELNANFQTVIEECFRRIASPFLDINFQRKLNNCGCHCHENRRKINMESVQMK